MDFMSLTDELKYGKVISTGKRVSLMTPLCRFDFVKLAEPEQYKGEGKFKFSIDMIFETDPSKPGAVDLKKLILPALAQLAKDTKVSVEQITSGRKQGLAFGTSQGHPHVVLRKGPRLTLEGEPYEGYEESSLFMSASDTPRVQSPPWKPVPCVSPAGEAGFPATEVYNGCWGRVIINPYKPKSWPMISIGLRGVQMIADGDPLGPGQSNLDAFGGVEGASVESPLEKAVEPVGDGDFSSFL